MMETKQLPEAVKEWMEIIRRSTNHDEVQLNEYCQKLTTYAEDTGSDFLKGYCLFYRGFHAYLQAHLDGAMELLNEALKYLGATEQWSVIAHCYNVMGNIAGFQGDVSLAIDCYIKSLRLACEHDLGAIEYKVRVNIANIQMSLNDMKNAVEMLLLGEKMVAGGLRVITAQRVVALANLTVCFMQLGEPKRAIAYLSQLRDLMNGRECSMQETIILCILETQYYDYIEDWAARDAVIEKLNQLDFKAMDIYDALSELKSHAQFLLEIGKYEAFHALIARMEHLSDSPKVRYYILALRLEFCRRVDDVETYSELAVQYYDISQKREEERNRIASNNIVTRMRLDEEAARRREVERSNAALKERSEHDALTGLYNRYKLNELSEAAFQRAYLSRKPLTVEILDIDCYKNFNDNYGHHAGDECLVKIGTAIRSMEEFPRIHTARYGGDEFVIVYEEYDAQEVSEMARILQNRILALNIEHKYSTVCERITVSQGLFNHVPGMNNKLWDFMYSADMALYIVKNTTKDGYYVGTDYRDVQEEYNSVLKR